MRLSDAIRFAGGAVSAPIGRGTSWTVIGPYYSSRIDGPYTEAHADSYWKARHIARQWRIGHALALGGIKDDSPEPYGSGDWRAVVRQVARAWHASRPPIKIDGPIWR